MASVYKRKDLGDVYHCSYYVPKPDGRHRQVRRSTGKSNRKEALQVAVELEKAALREAGSGDKKSEKINAVLAGLAMPCLLLTAEQGLAAASPDKYAALARGIPGVQLETAPGSHHFHMEGGVATLGQRIQRFLLDRG